MKPLHKEMGVNHITKLFVLMINCCLPLCFIGSEILELLSFIFDSTHKRMKKNYVECELLFPLRLRFGYLMYS